MANVTPAIDAVTESPKPASGYLDRIDRWAEAFGDRLNSILVKETRQALKSRQFVATFSILLFAALGWTVAGSLSMMPQIYTTPSASRLLVGYYIVLAVPMLLVVPLAAYRSLENEIDDGTLELLSITTLSPWQIVLGKLASAMLQMLLYFVALFPCVAYAYNLRGVDLPTLMLMLLSLLVVGIFLTIIALFFAPLARTRSGRIVTLLAVMAILMTAQWAMGMAIIEMIVDGVALRPVEAFYIVLYGVVFAASAGHLLLTATAAQLTPISENRSTAIRLSLLGFTAVNVALSAMTMRMDLGELLVIVPMTTFMLLGMLWLIAGSLMAGESSVITPRMRRELPSSFAARALLTFFTPGPTTGLALACVTGISLVGVFYIWTVRAIPTGPFFVMMQSEIIAMQRTCIAAAVYAVGLLVLSNWVMRLIRIRNAPRVEVGFAALVAVMVLTALVPYSIGLHMHDYISYPYNAWQATNWAWTITTVYSGARDVSHVLWIIGILSSLGLMATVFSQPRLVFPRRIATPRRVLEEQRRDAAVRAAGVSRTSRDAGVPSSGDWDSVQ